MQEIADWLEKLGLGQYAQRFAENDISFAVLPDLTEQDLLNAFLSARDVARNADQRRATGGCVVAVYVEIDLVVSVCAERMCCIVNRSARNVPLECQEQIEI